MDLSEIPTPSRCHTVRRRVFALDDPVWIFVEVDPPQSPLESPHTPSKGSICTQSWNPTQAQFLDLHPRRQRTISGIFSSSWPRWCFVSSLSIPLTYSPVHPFAVWANAWKWWKRDQSETERNPFTRKKIEKKKLGVRVVCSGSEEQETSTEPSEALSTSIFEFRMKTLKRYEISLGEFAFEMRTDTWRQYSAPPLSPAYSHGFFAESKSYSFKV